MFSDIFHNHTVSSQNDITKWIHLNLFVKHFRTETRVVKGVKESIKNVFAYPEVVETVRSESCDWRESITLLLCVPMGEGIDLDSYPTHDCISTGISGC